MDKNKELQVVNKPVVVDKNDTCIYENKKIYMYDCITCFGTLIIKDCHIVYGDTNELKSKIKAETGSKVEICNCLIEERSLHEDIFIEGDINEQDDVIISDCKFIQKFRSRFLNNNKPYISLKGGGVIKNCEFNIKSKLPFGIVKGGYDDSVYVLNYNNIHDISEGDIIDLEKYLEEGKSNYINLNKAAEGLQTLVSNCRFNKSTVGVFNNCIIDNCTFFKCKIATKDVYNVKNCRFIKCKKTILRNKKFELDNPLETCEFEHSPKKVHKISPKKDRRYKSFMDFLPSILFVLVLKAFAIGNLSIMAKGYKGDIEELTNSTLYWFYVWRMVLINFFVLYCVYFINKKLGVYIKTKALKYNFKNSISQLTGMVIITAILACVAYIPAKNLIKLYNDGTQIVNTKDYRVRIMYVDNHKEMEEISEEEAEKLIKDGNKSDIKYNIIIEDSKFNIDKEQYDKLKNYEGEIEAIYYNTPHTLISVKCNNNGEKK